MGDLPVMENDILKNSMVLMGVDWSRAAKTKAFKDIKMESPILANIIRDLDRLFRKKN